MLNMPSAVNAFAMIDQAFGTTIADVAEKYGIGCIDPDKKITRQEVMSLAIKYPDIASVNFSMVDYVSDMEKLSSTFGFKKGTVKLVGVDDNETFILGLNLIDMILSGLSLLPLNKSEKIKEGVYLVATTIKKFIPSMQNIGRLLAQAPALNKYAFAFDEFGQALDKALSILNEGKDPSEAIDIVKEAIHSIRKINIKEVMREAKENNVNPQAIPAEVVPDPDANKKNNKQQDKKEKKESKKESNSSPDSESKEAIINMSNSNDVAAQAAMQQGYIPDFMNPQATLDNPQGTIPEFMNPNLVPESPGSYVPEIISENRAQTPPPSNPANMVFSPVTQEDTSGLGWDVHFPFVREIIRIANTNGYYCVPEPLWITGSNDNRIKAIFFRIYNDNGYLYKKSFMVDCGSVIDHRFGIWPVGVADPQRFIPMECCNVAYHLFANKNDKNGPRLINAHLVENIIKYGFDGVDPQILRGHVLYNERMCITNRRIDMITCMDAYADNNARSIIRGALIRLAEKLDPAYGRFAFSSMSGGDMIFTLTNLNVPDYMFGPISPRPWVSILMKPKKDENGNYIPVNPKKGSDLIYEMSIDSAITMNNQQPNMQPQQPA